MTQDVLVEPPPGTARIVNEWLGEYVEAPHPDLGRTGAVCPFVMPSRRAATLVVRSCEWTAWRPAGAESGLARMLALIEEIVDHFERIEWAATNAMLHALLVVMPDLPHQDWHLIDDAHRQVKDEIVARGLMIGQFHPECLEPAARNPVFPVNRSPVPAFAIRNLALHDVLFLNSNRQWFEHYRAHFGPRYTGHVDPLFRSLFDEASRRFDLEPAG